MEASDSHLSESSPLRWQRRAEEAPRDSSMAGSAGAWGLRLPEASGRCLRAVVSLPARWV